MGKFNLPLVAEGLTAYAIERQNGFERHQPDRATPWTEQRRFWTDAVLQGMARLEGREPDMTLMSRYDHDLEQARGSLTSPASPQIQNDTVRELHSFVSALAASSDDRRRQINVVRELLEDMASHLPWAGVGKALDHARDDADRALVRMTAQMPIRFTHIFMGGDSGPWASGFVSGCVRDPEAVRESAAYQEAARKYPDIQDWVTLCVSYVGRGLPSAMGAVDASAFDLEIMNRTGDSFLKEQGVRWLSGPYQMTIEAEPVQSQDDSFQLNVCCARDIEQAIRDCSNGADENLKDGCAQSILEKYGFKRVSFVLANSLREIDKPQFLSEETRQWLSETYAPSDGRNKQHYAVITAIPLLESFVAQTREAYAGLGLFDPEHCVGNRNELDYTGKVLVMNPDTLRESYWNAGSQLWYAHDGFGCSPNSLGRSIRCTCLGDGEQTRWNRGDFIGVLDEQFLPDWAVDMLSELRGEPVQTAKAHLSERDISFAEEISEVGNLLNFYMETNFDVDAVFGTNVCTPENDDWLNVYANYDMESGQVCGELEIALHRGDGSEESLAYPLSKAEKEILLRKMDDYCRQQTGQSLAEYSAQMVAEDLSPPDGPVMQ